MSDFKAKMQQYRIRLGPFPRPCWGSLQCSPNLLAGLTLNTFYMLVCSLWGI